MTALFFYGTLRHMPLLELVLGRDADRIEAVEGRLPNHAVSWAEGQHFPLIHAAPGRQAAGLWVGGLGPQDVARLDHYEGAFAYSLQEVRIDTDTGPRAALVYFPDPGHWSPGAPWSLADWVAREGELTLIAAEEVMHRFGRTPPDVMAELLPFIRARAWARILARDTAPHSLRSSMRAGEVEILREREGFDGFFRMRAFDLRHRRFDGSVSGPIPREAFIAFDAAMVLPWDPATDRVLLIEQLRYGPLMRGDPNPWMLEPVAGLVDAGEPPETTALREAVEEAGLHLDTIEPMLRVYPSPGYSTEYFHCYLGRCDLGAHRADAGGGLASENEDIRSHILSLDAALDLVETGEVNEGPLAMMLLWLARHRERLRASA